MSVIDYKFSEEARKLSYDLISGIDTLWRTTALEYPQLQEDAKNNVLESLSRTIFMQWSSSNTDIELDAAIKENQRLYALAVFLSKSCVLAYLGKFDNDKNLDALRKEKHDILVEELLKEKQDKLQDDEKAELSEEEDLQLTTRANMAFEFGYNELGSLVQGSIEAVENIENYKNIVDGRVESNLLSSMRSITYEEYLTGGYLEKDIKLIALMGNKPKDELVSEILDIIKSSDAYNGYISETLLNILCEYKYFFQDSFGLVQYAGILSFAKPYSLCIDESNYLSEIKGAKANFDNIANFLKKQMSVDEQKDRQFNIDAIIDSKLDVPLYFPCKMVEYAMGRELTYNLTEKVYKAHSSSDSWEHYSQDYVKKQIERCILETIYKTIERNFDIQELSWIKSTSDENGEPFSFAGDSFQCSYHPTEDNKQREELELYITDARFTNAVHISLKKLINSLCTCAAIVKYNNIGGKANSISLRIIDTTNSLNEDMTSKLYGSMVLNDSIQFEKGDVISKGKTNERGEPLLFKIYEFRHDFDAKLATAEPLFGYTAVQLYLDQKKPMGWDKILLGEDTKGTPLFASVGNADDIPLQNHTVHNMMAGSRSGKGVMTMNILASAIASNKPVFYIDRKPDMAVMFYDLTKGNMFIVNGGQYVAKNDMHGYFNDTGAAVNGWKTAYESLPGYLTDAINGIFPQKKYNGVFGDFVYYRAMLLIYAILLARASGTTNPDVYNNLGGDNGIVAVFDEFKNWQENFETQFFSVNGVFARPENRLNSKELSEYKKMLSDIKVKETQKAMYNSDPRKATQAEKLQLDIDMINERIKSTYTPFRVYCTTIMEKLGDTMKCMSESFGAGFKDGECKKSDIFVIGQHIDIDDYYNPKCSTGIYTEAGSGNYNNNKDTQNKSLMRGLLNNFPPTVDWFMGLNHEVQDKYMGATKENGGEAYKWITEKQYWAYVSGVPMETLRTETPPNVTYFKPYLVLNNNKEDDPNNRKYASVPTEDGTGSEMVIDEEYNFVGQCRDRVNGAVANLWEKVRLKHLTEYRHSDPRYIEAVEEAQREGGDKQYGNLNSGIGFEGLARLTKTAAYNGLLAQGQTPSFSPELDLTQDLGESKRIADFAASKLGYSSYQEYLFDFSPKGIFSVKDMVNCILGAESPVNLHSRLHLFFEYNVFNSEEQETDATPKKLGDTMSKSSEDALKVLSAPIKEEIKQEEHVQPLNETVETNEEQQASGNIADSEIQELLVRYGAKQPQGISETEDFEPVEETESVGIIESKEEADRKKLYLTENDLIATYMFDLMEQIESVTLEQKGPMPVAFYKGVLNDMRADNGFINALLDCAKDDNPDMEVILNE